MAAGRVKVFLVVKVLFVLVPQVLEQIVKVAFSELQIVAQDR